VESEGKRPPGRFGRRRDDNIKTDVLLIVREAWTALIWLRMQRSGVPF